MQHEITCGDCRREQTTKAAKAAGARCISELCGSPICIFCGCTQNAPCFIYQRQLLSPEPDYCAWIAPGICSNPTCIELAYQAITPAEIREAQRYYQTNPLEQRNKVTTIEDLQAGLIKTENELANVIINHLILEDQGHLLNTLGIDVFDIISGSYDDTAIPLLNEIFDEWNQRIGAKIFASGKDHLATVAA
jgi:hypothetical protein